MQGVPSYRWTLDNFIAHIIRRYLSSFFYMAIQYHNQGDSVYNNLHILKKKRERISKPNILETKLALFKPGLYSMAAYQGLWNVVTRVAYYF